MDLNSVRARATIGLTLWTLALCLTSTAGPFIAGPARANDTLVVGDTSAGPGELRSGWIRIPDTGDAKSTAVPVTVANGVGDGPVLALIAGVHGSEYPPILALQRLVRQIDPAALSGAVIVVHNANLPAFQGRTVYFTPDDRKNLNRSFPGDPSGSLTERIAHGITEQVIRQSHYLIDIHAGDANERLSPSYTAYYAEAGSVELREQSRRMVMAFGLNTIVLFGGDLTTPASQIYTSAQAVALGIPAMDVESGELGRTADEYVAPITSGVLSVMRDLGMIPGSPTPARAPLIIADRARVYSEHDGVWHPAPGIEAGQFVSEGSLLGRITDYHGNAVADVLAPASGILLILFGTPPVNHGDNIAVIGRVEN